MFTVPDEKMHLMLEVAQEYQDAPVGYEFTILESCALRLFFTNQDKKVFLLFNLPPALGTALLAMFSRMKNPRGVRGNWVDSFLLYLLASNTAEVQDGYSDNSEATKLEEKFLKSNAIKSLDDFVEHSDECRALFEEFLSKGAADPEYYQSIAESKRVKVFLSTWLDAYGHNSIARMGSMWICCEDLSLLAAKSLEWSRPGTGYIELSTRYVDMGGKQLYPIAKMLSAAYGSDQKQIEAHFESLFESYRVLFGENTDGILPSFYAEEYAALYQDDQADLKMGIAGETADVLGNLLPLATLTHVATACTGEALPGILRHLYLDGTPENRALINAILGELPKIGAESYVKHWMPTAAEVQHWSYLSVDSELWDRFESGELVRLLGGLNLESMSEAMFLLYPDALEIKSTANFEQAVSVSQREYHDKVGRVFELVTSTFIGKMSMRGWRDLHRMSYSTHLRTLVTPKFGFYQYDKPAPVELEAMFRAAADRSSQLYYEDLAGIPEFLLQYVLPMGFIVGYLYAANLRQMEFSIWQRTKPSVNHEVRQAFQAMDEILADHIPRWENKSRGRGTQSHCEPAYIFARSKDEMGKPLLLPKTAE